MKNCPSCQAALTDEDILCGKCGLVLAKWKSPKQIKIEYPSASFLANNRVVFNIKGNKYRLITKINYEYRMIWIRFIGTHAEYDKIDATNI